MPPEYSLLISQPGSEVPNYGGGGGVLGKSISGGNLRQLRYVKYLGQNYRTISRIHILTRRTIGKLTSFREPPVMSSAKPFC